MFNDWGAIIAITPPFTFLRSVAERFLGDAFKLLTLARRLAAFCDLLVLAI
jgi:hypothetical protein